MVYTKEIIYITFKEESLLMLCVFIHAPCVGVVEGIECVIREIRYLDQIFIQSDDDDAYCEIPFCLEFKIEFSVILSYFVVVELLKQSQKIARINELG